MKELDLKDIIQVDDKEFKANVTLSYKDESGRFAFYVKPSKVEEFIEKAKHDIDLVKTENFLKSHGFSKKDGKWNKPLNKRGQVTIKFPAYCYRDGDLLVKLGVVETNLDFSQGSLSTLENLPDKILPFKDKGRKVYDMYDLTFIAFREESTHTFSAKQAYEYDRKARVIPLYEANEDKVNRWFNKDFENLSIKNYKIDFINWYIDKYPERAERFYKYFEQGFNVLIKEDKRKKILEFKAPKGFKEWICNKKGEDFRNFMMSIEAASKFKL